MGKSQNWQLIIIVVIALVAMFVDLDIEHPAWAKNLLFWQPANQRDIALRLGLDLQGGLQVLLAADPQEGQELDAAAMETARRIVENRVNALGLTEPIVQAQGERRIIVELPGIQNPEQAVETIKGTALLEFVDAGNIPLPPGTVITTTLGGPTLASPAAELTAPTDTTTWTEPTPEPTRESVIAPQMEPITVPPEASPPMPENPVERNEMYTAPPEMQIETTETYVANISTAKGEIVVQLNASAAPQTVNNFIFLSERGFYDGLTFHRVEPGFVIQGGDPLGMGSGGPGYTVPAEIGLPHTLGAIAMARRGDDVNPERASSGSQFYIALDTLTQLDGAYTVFGQVVEGMDVVQSIAIGDVIETVTISTADAPITPTVPTPSPSSPAIAPKIYETVLTGADLKNVGLDTDQRGAYVIPIEFNPDAAQVFADYTSTHVGQYLCILLDKTVVSCPVIQDVIPTGQASISGNFTFETARQLALQLRYGALPIPMKVESFNRIGATLGTESVEKSIRAGVIGLVTVLVFMLVYYRLPGGLADIALVIYVLINIALYKLVPITLTLPGIAGFILSAGMAVDANILIFERMKEELRNGRKLATAIEIGFSRAWPSIRDGQLSTLIICAILFFFGTNFGASIVKGFAITLAIGTVVNIFTAVFATRTFVSQVTMSADQWLAEREWLLGV
ncbi:MAG TPA: protein translocase subunit SecD [Chloroflexi bacterium]|nr:protein translocase subunit SecD [Chloroflexota bacterium]